MSEINTIFSEVSLALDLEDQKDATDLLVDITDMSSGSIIFFVAGYIARGYSEVAKM